MKVPEMDEKGILGGEAQAMGEAEERVSDNDNRRAGPEGKRRKKSASAKATVGRKEASVAKPLGNAAEVTKVSPTKGMPSKMPSEAPPVKPVPSKVTAEAPPVKPVPAKVAAVPSVATSMPTKSLDMSR